jgi:putative hydrolase of the HAD superfamily
MPVLLFDLFGVLACHQSDTAKAEIERIADVDPERFWRSYWAMRPAYDSGHRTALRYWESVASDLGVVFNDRRVAELTDADLRSWSEVDPEMICYIGELAGGGARLGLLSNIPVDLADEYERRHGWLDLFSVRGFSCRIGSAKPDPAAYRWCVAEFGVPASEVLFIDDRTENVDSAVAVGLRGHVFTSLAALRATLATA